VEPSIVIPGKTTASVHPKSRRIVGEFEANHGLMKPKFKEMRLHATAFAARHSTKQEDVDPELPTSYTKLRMVKKDKLHWLSNLFAILKLSTQATSI
jgi:hypothetical protein